MNFLIIIAFALAMTVIGVTVVTSTDDVMAFVDFHGALVVMGGTLACAAIAYQLDRIWLMLKVFFNRMVLGKKPNYKATIKELMNLADAFRSSEDKFRQELESSKDPFVKECGTILTDGLIEGDELKRVLNNRVKTIYQRYSADASMFQSLGKYPPAMGLMGAVIGMVALLKTIGQPGAESKVGPAMSVALIATFYGIAFANLVVVPIGDNLMDSAREIKTKNMIILEGMLLISKKINPLVLAEELNSYLLPSERIDWKAAS